MTLWHDQTSRRERSQTLEDRDRATIETEQEAQPGSRRAARERERRAAEALAAGQQHPSGVVDFGDHDLDPDFGAEAGLASEATTSDIWEALSRASGQDTAAPAPAPADRRSARRAAEAAEEQARQQSSAMPEGLMERVRDRVLQDHAASAESAPTAQPSAPAAEPATPLTRRQLRQQQAEQTVDGMPASWFTEAGSAATPAATPETEIPEAFGGHESGAHRIGAVQASADEADDLEGLPTVRMSAVDRATLQARLPMTGPVDLPQYFSDPVGDDELAFSSPVLPDLAQPLSQHAAVEDVARFQPPTVEPVQPWAAQVAGQGRARAVPLQTWAQQAAATAAPRVEPDTETGPTDLAGFEALIARSRGSLAPETGLVVQQPGRQPEEAEDPHAGFSGLLSRNVATPHGSQNALIMPSDPQPDLTTAVTGTGEQFITGSMNLSRSLATTGGTAAHYDSLEVDRLFETPEEPASGVTPIRAVRAVSSGASTHDVRPRRSRSSALPVVLAIVAGVMAVGVITLLVGSWVLKIF
ncbi:hypothetical protein [uncultured Amnibacterium sp.]|uniref:hypothetical protein n=1 Tax=uncultured Amnibacterium sp. TaxID=1631851 RepID=UPI0035CC2E4D